MQRIVFPLFSMNHDEPVYALPAEALRDGHLTLAAGDALDQRFLRPWLTGIHGDRFYTVYPPGLPAVLAAGELLGSQRLAVAAIAALTVVGSYAFGLEVLRRQACALVVAGAIALSPILVVQGGLRLSYLWSLACGLLFGTAVLRSLRTGSRVLAVAAGLALGAVLLTRPFDALLWAMPFAVVALLGYRYSPRQLLTTAGYALVAFVPFVALLAAYSAVVTGELGTLPAVAAEPLNRFGFGDRGIASTSPPLSFGPRDALEALGTNLRTVPAWAAGGVVGLLLAILGLVHRRRDPAAWLVVVVVVAFPAGYFFYWGTVLQGDGAEALGPQYYLPMFSMLAILAADGLVLLWESWRAVATVAALLALALAGWATADKISKHIELTEDYRRTDRVVRDADLRDALLFVPYDTDPFLLEGYPFLGNGPTAGGPVVYAVDLGAENFAYIAARPERSPYRLTTRRDPDGGFLDSVPHLERLRVHRGDRYVVRVEVTNPGAGSYLVS